ncbi:MAG: tetratricopeptide repeat protein [Bacteroidales bacterium]|nr:tetratricopeptide repeat protein [Bacteroidales bacterium]
MRKNIFLISIAFLLSLQISAQSSFGDSLYNLGLLDQAIEAYSAEFNVEKNSDQPDLEHAMHLMTSLGSVCEDAGRLDEALEWYLMYKNFVEKYNPNEIGNALNLIGNVWFRLGDFSTAIEYYFKSLYFSQINDDPLAISSASNNIGNVYFSLNRYEDADKYYQNAIRLKLEFKDYSELPSCLINAGNVKMLLEDYRGGEVYFRKALQISTSQGNQFRALSAMVSLGILFERTEQIDSAYYWFETALEIIDEDQLSVEYIMTLRGLGALELGAGHYRPAIGYLQKALQLTQSAGLTDISTDILELLAEACDKAGLYKESSFYYKSLKTLNDSLFDTGLSEKLSQNESSYENLLKRKTIEMQQLDIESGHKINRFLMWLIIIITVSLLTITLFIIRIFRNRNKYQKRLLEGRIQEVRLQALRAQINPHFVSNALNSIQNFFINGDVEQATDYLADFGQLIRMVLDNSHSSYIPLSDEVGFLKLYIKLEQLRLSGHFEYEVECSPELLEMNPMVPPLIVQPYVENAIWHGLSHLKNGGKLIVKYQELHSDIKVSVEDNGIGMERSAELYKQYPRKRKSYAMSINKERVKLFKEYFDRDLSVKFSDLCEGEQSGTRVEIIIPRIERSDS